MWMIIEFVFAFVGPGRFDGHREVAFRAERQSFRAVRDHYVIDDAHRFGNSN